MGQVDSHLVEMQEGPRLATRLMAGPTHELLTSPSLLPTKSSPVESAERFVHHMLAGVQTNSATLFSTIFSKPCVCIFRLSSDSSLKNTTSAFPSCCVWRTILKRGKGVCFSPTRSIIPEINAKKAKRAKNQRGPEVQDAPSFVVEHNKDPQETKDHSRHGEEVHPDR
jgi:hypothetical protein